MIKILPFLSSLFVIAIGVAYYFDFKKTAEQEKKSVKPYYIILVTLVGSTFIFMLIRFILKHKGGF